MRSRTMRLSPQVNAAPDKEHYVTFPGGGRPREESTRGSRPTRGLRPSARTQAVQSVETGTGAHGWTASAPATLPGLQPAALSVQRALAPSAVTCSRFASRPSRCRPTGRRTFRRAAGSSLLPSRPDPLPTFVDNCDYPRNLQCCNACRSLNLLARISPSNVRANGPSSEVERQSLAIRRSRRRRAPSSSIIDLHLQDRPQGWDLDGFFERRRTTARVVTPLSCRPMSCLRTSRGRGQGHPPYSLGHRPDSTRAGRLPDRFGTRTASPPGPKPQGAEPRRPVFSECPSLARLGFARGRFVGLSPSRPQNHRKVRCSNRQT